MPSGAPSCCVVTRQMSLNKRGAHASGNSTWAREEGPCRGDGPGSREGGPLPHARPGLPRPTSVSVSFKKADARGQEGIWVRDDSAPTGCRTGHSTQRPVQYCP